MDKRKIFFVICFATGIHCNPLFPYDLVDLTRNLGPDSIYYPTLGGYEKVIELKGSKEFGHWVYSNVLKMTEHVGTHMDAPSHFNKVGWNMHQIPINKMVGPGVIVNVKEKARNNPDYRISLNDIKEWEEKYGKIPDGAMLIMNSGWDVKYPDKYSVYGTKNMSDRTSFHHPGWHEDTISWIISNRHILFIGTDAPSFDYGQSTTFPVHILTSRENICGLENVANLDRIPPSGSIISAAGMKTVEGSGGPLRLYAMVPNSDANNSAVTIGTSNVLLVVICLTLLIKLQN
ncbi:Hypothetical predicted protein [Mytilus galloprovincialis]|uniref:Kynurenine formamidase n=2 Tax=Mytilus galloprovincialis TaxID=29158 RepID=A0A8B6ES21_MYTGA|nr:Hypothetical predicted protein [Mytilus galloprovincialis]